MRAGALDQRAQTGLSERFQRGPEFHSAGPSRCFWTVVHRLTARARFEVCRGGTHGAAQGLAVADDYDAAVVADVGPLVGVGGPRVGSFESACEVAIFRRSV